MDPLHLFKKYWKTNKLFGRVSECEIKATLHRETALVLKPISAEKK